MTSSKPTKTATNRWQYGEWTIRRERGLIPFSATHPSWPIDVDGGSLAGVVDAIEAIEASLARPGKR